MFDLTKTERVYIAVGYSDFRHGIAGFAAIIQQTKRDDFSPFPDSFQSVPA